MGFYSRVIFPRLCDWVMSDPRMAKLRTEVLADVDGEVLEIGFGTGLNLAHYHSAVRRITTVDPNPAMSHLARRRIADSGIAVDQRASGGERLPFEDETFDVPALIGSQPFNDIRVDRFEMERVARTHGTTYRGVAVK